MCEKYTADYFLGPEFQNDSSMLRPLADALVQSQDTCGLNVAEAHFFLLFTKYAGTLKLLASVMEKIPAAPGNSGHKYTREELAARFREICTLQEDVAELTAEFVNHCACMIDGKI